VAALNPALAAATVGVSVWRKLIYSLIWQSVMWRPGKLRFLISVKNPLPIDRPRPPENTAPCGTPPVARFALRSGYALPSSRIRRYFLILIDVLFSSCSPRSTGCTGARLQWAANPILSMLGRSGGQCLGRHVFLVVNDIVRDRPAAPPSRQSKVMHHGPLTWIE
jgi:hypothetical protein